MRYRVGSDYVTSHVRSAKGKAYMKDPVYGFLVYRVIEKDGRDLKPL